MSLPPPSPAAVLRAHAHAALAELSRLPALAAPASLTVTDSGLGVSLTLTLAPCGRGAPEMSDCARDVLNLLAGAQCRWTTSRILHELARRALLHGESTTKRCLASLVRTGLLRSSRRAPRGYWLPDAPFASCPLFPDPPKTPPPPPGGS